MLKTLGRLLGGILFLYSSLIIGQTKTPAKPVACLYGTMSPHTDMDSWFTSMKNWGVERYYLYSPNYRGYQYKINSPVQMGYDQSNFYSIALLSDLYPGYAPFINKDEVTHQEDLIQKVKNHCAKNHIEFGMMIPFPLFPVQKLDVVKQVQPEFVRSDGRLNIYSPQIPVLLKDEIRLMKKKVPELKSICIWLAEGCGEIYKFEDDDLVHNKEWMLPILQALDEICTELQMEGVAFSHDYFHTVKTRSQSFEAMAQYPRITLMEDVSWPEENTLMPFLGHFTAADKKVLKDNNLMLNILTDTEYLGQGNWPGVYTRWWQKHARAAQQVKCSIIAGRTFFWDNAKTDQNFNRLNAQLLMHFARNPKADAYQALTKAMQETYGKTIPKRLVDILWETEPMIQKIIAINGISSLNHSGFPRGYYLDKAYYNWHLNMKAVDDLFQPPGTRCYPPLTDTLTASRYWRYQLQTIAKPYAAYLKEKDEAINWLNKVNPEVKKLTAQLPAHQQKMFTDGYDQLLLLAKGMRCFVQAAKVHYDWYRAKSINQEQALASMKPIAAQLRELAATDPGYPLGYGNAMKQFANEIEKLQFSKGKW